MLTTVIEELYCDHCEGLMSPHNELKTLQSSFIQKFICKNCKDIVTIISYRTSEEILLSFNIFLSKLIFPRLGAEHLD